MSGIPQARNTLMTRPDKIRYWHPGLHCSHGCVEEHPRRAHVAHKFTRNLSAHFVQDRDPLASERGHLQTHLQTPCCLISRSKRKSPERRVALAYRPYISQQPRSAICCYANSPVESPSKFKLQQVTELSILVCGLSVEARSC